MRLPTFLRYLFLLVPAASQAEIAVEKTLGVLPVRLEWAGNDQLLISMSDRGEACVWEAATGNLLHTLPSSSIPTASELVASSDGEWIGTIENGKAIITHRKTQRVAWSSDEVVVKLTGLTSSSVILAFNNAQHHAERVARIQWPEGKVIAEWKAPDNSLFAPMHSISQGRTAVSMSGRTTYILDKNLQQMARFAPQEPAPFYFSHSSSQGPWISLATYQGAMLANADEPEKGFQAVKSLRGWTYVPSPDGSRWFGGRLGYWAIYDREGKPIAAAELLERVFYAGVVWSADGRTLAAPSSEGIQLIDAHTGKRIRKFGNLHLAAEKLFDGSESAALSSAGRMLTIKTADGDWSLLDCRHPLEWKRASEAVSRQPGHSSLTDSLILRTQDGWQRHGNGTVETLQLRGESSWSGGVTSGDSIWRHSNDEMTVYSFRHGKEADGQSFPLSRTKVCVASSDGQWALHQAQDAKQLVLRRAPDWQVVAEFTLPDGQPEALLASPDGSHVAWMDGKHRWWSYALGADGPENKLTLPGGTFTGGFTHSSAPSLAVCWQMYRSPFRGIVVDVEGITKYQIGSWKHFTDETDLLPLGFGPARKHLWLCGPGARPILVDLASGQPLLRLHFLADGVPLWEMASGKFYGPDAAKAYLKWTDLHTTRALSASELAAVWSEKAFRAVMNAYLGGK